MGELTAEMVQQGRNAGLSDAVHRRRAAQDMRAAREKLTSSVGLERAFEYELVSIFAQYHLSASPVLVILAAAITGAATFWLPLPLALMWLVLMV